MEKFFIDTEEMNHLKLSKLVFSHYVNDYFVETGTFTGRAVAAALASGFRNIYSVELESKKYKKAKRKFDKYENVHLFCGDSKKVLKAIIKKINEPITFWLDAHVCEFGHDHGETEPLKGELSAIKSHVRNDHTILIDDVNHVDRYGFTYRGLIDVLLDINPDYEVFRHKTVNNKVTKIFVARPNIFGARPNILENLL